VNDFFLLRTKKRGVKLKKQPSMHKTNLYIYIEIFFVDNVNEVCRSRKINSVQALMIHSSEVCTKVTEQHQSLLIIFGGKDFEQDFFTYLAVRHY
jgi:hypothetical protein